jgi:hypothetical protein
VERDGKSLLEWIRIHFLRGLPGLAGPELGFSRTPTASVLRNDACLRLPARNTVLPNVPQDELAELITGASGKLYKSLSYSDQLLVINQITKEISEAFYYLVGATIVEFITSLFLTVSSFYTDLF